MADIMNGVSHETPLLRDDPRPVPYGDEETFELVNEPSIADAAMHTAVSQHRRVLGRYLVLEKVGAGGMGVVHAAYDPELDRKVAIKLLRVGSLTGSSGDDDGARLRHEAQAMAKLSHPNVLPVFDVGTVAGEVFIATELVDGCTLGQWVRERPRSWRDVLQQFLAAGQGLAAAHAIGLAHLDFKPSNVMVGKDGSVRVMDFGLAQRSGQAKVLLEGRSTTDPEDPANPSPKTAPSTKTGAALGTPRYMAPEQHLGGVVDARADQYAFCVSLYQALYGQFPFAESKGKELLEAKQHKKFAAIDSKRRIPGWVRRAILRGLEPEPEKRWPSLPELLRALSNDPRRKVMRVAAAVVLLSGALTGGWAYGKVQENRNAMCSGASTKLAGVWDTGVQKQVERAFLATNSPTAKETWEHLKPALDGYTGAWMMMHTDACEAMHVRKQQSKAVLDLRMACLDTRLRSLEALTKLFALADARTVQRAITAVGSLESVDRCGQLDRLQNGVAPPPANVQERVQQLQQELTNVRALATTGRYGEASPRADALLKDAKEIGYVPLLAEVQYMWGSLQEGLGNYEAAAETFAAAGWLAEGHGMEEVTFQAQSNRIMVAMRMGQFDTALRWGRHAQATLARLDSEPEFEAPLHHALGAVYDAQRKFDEARVHWERALEARLRVKNGDPLAVAMHHGMLAVIASEQRRFEDAAEHYRKDYEISSSKLGPNHPRIGILFLNMGTTAHVEAKYDRAREHFERAFGIFEPSVGAGHPYAAKATDGVARVLMREGEFEAAVAMLRKSLVSMKQRPQPDHPTLTDTTFLLASALVSARDVEGATEVLAESRALVEKHWANDSAMTARQAAIEGKLQATQGEHGLAIATLRRALEAVEKAEGSYEELEATVRVDLAQVLRSTHWPLEAATVLEPVLAIAKQVERPTLGDAHFEMAQALIATDRNRALGHAAEAMAIYGTLGDTFAAQRDAVGRWTVSHRE